MQPEERDPAYLWDMLMAARLVVEFTRNAPLDAFLSDNRDAEIMRLAVERKLEILGEAARRVSPHFRETHPEIPWAQIIGLRNLISHEYDRVDHEYAIAREEALQLITLLEPLIPPLPPEDDD